MTHKSYEKYKTSNEVWIDRFPDHWKILRAKNIFMPIDIRSKDGKEDLLSVSEKRGVTLRSAVNVTMFKAESYVGYKLCWPGDLVINSLWAWMQGLGVSKYHGIVSSAYGVYRLKDDKINNSKYLDYLLRSVAYLWELRVRSKGIWRSRYQLTDDAFFDMPILVPPPEEQTQIARYLDWKTAQINKFIRAKKRMIELLKEKKQAIINDAVTGKIDVKTGKPFESYRNIIAAEINIIPTDWEVCRIKNIAKIFGRIGFRGYTQDDIVNKGEGAISLSPSNIKDGNLILNKLTYISWDKYYESPEIMVHLEDIIMVKTGSSFGKAALIDHLPSLMTINPQLVVLKRLKIHPKYLLLIINSEIVQNQIKKLIIGGATPTIGQNTLSQLFICFPEIPYQMDILDYLNKEISGIDNIINKVEKELRLIAELKNKIISDVVTGKVDVRGISLSEIKQDDILPLDSNEIEEVDESSENEELAYADN